MTRIRAWLLTAVCYSVAADAAEVTDLASMDSPHAYGVSLDATFERTQQQSNIAREYHEGGDVRDASELRYIGVDSRLNLDLRLGVGGRFEFRYGLPIVLAQDRQWKFRAGNNSTSSSLVNNCVRADGSLVDPNCPTTLAGRVPMVSDSGGGVVGRTFRKGLGDMTFGITYAVLRDDGQTQPTWTVSFDWQAPTAQRFDFVGANTPESPGSIGERVHRYEISSAFSRRIGMVEPYVRLHVNLPAVGPGAYSNCDDPDPNRMAMPGNCGVAGWTKSVAGLRPATRTGMMFGSELIVFEDVARWQKLAIDLQAEATYVSKSRGYNEVSELFGKILATGDHGQVGASVGVMGELARSLQLNLGASLFYLTDHLLTAEELGRGTEANTGVVPNPDDVNPNFDYRLDLPSRRLRLEDSVAWRIHAGVTLSY